MSSLYFVLYTYITSLTIFQYKINEHNGLIKTFGTATFENQNEQTNLKKIKIKHLIKN